MEYELKNRGRYGDITVPECIIEDHKSLAVNNFEEIDSEEEYEELYREEYSEWSAMIDEFFWERFCEVEGTLVSKEEAEFWKKRHLSKVSPKGGYPKEAQASFEDHGDEYGAVTFFWSGEMEQDWQKPHILAYKKE